MPPLLAAVPTDGEGLDVRSCEYAAAAYKVFGLDERRFLEDWEEVVKTQNRGTLDGSPVAQAILAFMENRSEWEGPPATCTRSWKSRPKS